MAQPQEGAFKEGKFYEFSGFEVLRFGALFI